MFEKSVFKKNPMVWSIIAFSTAFLMFLIYFIGLSISGQFDVGEFVWLFVDIIFFGGIIVGYILKKRNIVAVATVVLLSYNLINCGIGGFSSISNVSFFNVENGWPYALIGIFMLFVGTASIGALALLIMAYFFKKTILKDIGVICMWAVAAIYLFCIIFQIVYLAINGAGQSWFTIFWYLFVPTLFFALSIPVIDYENKK